MSYGKVVTLAGERETEIVEIDDKPDIEGEAILTEVIQTNVCGSEVHFWKGEFPVPNGSVLGHEAVLRVLEMGEEASTDSAGNRIQEGDIITPVYFKPCGECGGCSNGQFYACEVVKSMGEWMQPHSIPPHFRGTFATHYYVDPDQRFYKVPEEVTNHVGPDDKYEAARETSDKSPREKHRVGRRVHPDTTRQYEHDRSGQDERVVVVAVHEEAAR